MQSHYQAGLFPYTDESRTLRTRIREENAFNTFGPLEDIHSQWKTGRLPTRPYLIAALTDRVTTEDILLKVLEEA